MIGFALDGPVRRLAFDWTTSGAVVCADARWAVSARTPRETQTPRHVRERRRDRLRGRLDMGSPGGRGEPTILFPPGSARKSREGCTIHESILMNRDRVRA